MTGETSTATDSAHSGATAIVNWPVRAPISTTVDAELRPSFVWMPTSGPAPASIFAS